jgi:hypothetical protein
MRSAQTFPKPVSCNTDRTTSGSVTSANAPLMFATEKTNQSRPLSNATMAAARSVPRRQRDDVPGSTTP